MANLMYNISQETPKDVREVNPDIPIGLAYIIHQLLQKEVAARYQHGKALAEDLQRYLAGRTP
jgi:hypothetical protein